MLEVVGDIEANDLLNHKSIDYLSSPYKLKDSFTIHCASFIDINTNDTYDFDPDNIHLIPEFLGDCSRLIFHNGINYDYLAMKLFFNLDYKINEVVGEKDIWDGREVELDDTLVMSKVLNPDRFGGHSIEAYGKRFGYPKIDWRKRAEELDLCKRTDPAGAEFKTYHPEMLVYCKKDTEIGLKVYRYLREEWGSWNWEEAYKLEKKVADIITRQEHRGFYFYKDRAEEAVKDLDAKMSKIEDKVLPLIPPKQATQATLKEMSFPAKPFKKDGSVASSMLKWLDKKQAKAIFNKSGDLVGVNWLDKEWYVPFPTEPVVSEVPATLKDTTHIKEWLVGLGWKPKSFKDRDLTTDQKKVKISKEKFVTAVNRYVDQTLSSNFCMFRCEHLKVKPEELRTKLLSHDMSKPLKVLTNPTFTVGQEKEVDPNLLKLEEQFPYAKDIVYWLTYSHRRNSILGGGLDWEYGEEAEKGYLAQDRINIDNRIPTPADTCGCSTSRMQHRVVANIPRSSSLYGQPMRSLFGCDPDTSYQIGHDADGLEARMKAHWISKYKGGKELGEILQRPKPQDVHWYTANFVSDTLGVTVSRDSAKQIGYSCDYGAQPPRIAKDNEWSLTKAKQFVNAYWSFNAPVALLVDRLNKYWKTTGGKKFIPSLDNRKVPSRSGHKLLNDLLQSSGLICMKRAAVIQYNMLEKEGLIVDFFRDDWRNKSFSQQMIHYHK